MKQNYKSTHISCLCFAILLLFSACAKAEIETAPDPEPSQPDQSETVVPEKEYQLVWCDEFNSESRLPDTQRWWFETGDNGWGNNELQNYIPMVRDADTCAFISEGTLKIVALKSGDEVLSVRMNSRESWTYGYFEARLRLPSGKGTWPAFWMMPVGAANWPACGEIDIMEEVGFRPNWVSSAIHCSAYNHAAGTQKTAERFVEDADTAFHVYGLEWTPDSIKTYIDGVCLFTFANDGQGNEATWPFNKPFYLKLNLAWGGNWGGQQGVDESQLPATYEVDYVRVYQRP